MGPRYNVKRININRNQGIPDHEINTPSSHYKILLTVYGKVTDMRVTRLSGLTYITTYNKIISYVIYAAYIA